MTLRRCLGSLVVALLLAGVLPAADWPQFRGPKRDGVSTETGLLKTWPTDGLPLVWCGERLAAVALERTAEAEVDLADLPAAVEQAFGADVAIGDLGSGFDGLSVATSEIKLILVARSVVPWRQRFTIAHPSLKPE